MYVKLSQIFGLVLGYAHKINRYPIASYQLFEAF